jgi:hypothetical protein
MILAGGFRAALNAQLSLQALCQSLNESHSTEESWGVLCAGLDQFGFTEIQWSSGDNRYHQVITQITGKTTWELRIPLTGQDYVELKRLTEAPLLHLNIGTLAEALRSSLVKDEPAPQTHTESLVAASIHAA